MPPSRLAGPLDFFMSLGANGQFETDSQRSFSCWVNVEGNGKISRMGPSVGLSVDEERSIVASSPADDDR